MRAALLSLLALAVAIPGCEPAQRAGPLPTQANDSGLAASAQAAPAPRVTSLAGEWRVAGIDGTDFNEAYGLALKGDGERLWWEPLCALQARRYRITGSAVRFSSAYSPPRRDDPPPLICLIAPPARLADVMRALDSAQTVERTSQNGIVIAGGGHSLLLFSQ
jgi:hypothetical protein